MHTVLILIYISLPLSLISKVFCSHIITNLKSSWLLDPGIAGQIIIMMKKKNRVLTQGAFCSVFPWKPGPGEESRWSWATGFLSWHIENQSYQTFAPEGQNLCHWFESDPLSEIISLCRSSCPVSPRAWARCSHWGRCRLNAPEQDKVQPCHSYDSFLMSHEIWTTILFFQPIVYKMQFRLEKKISEIAD